jgi:carbon-monoxide dehydrogenase small subunit
MEPTTRKAITIVVNGEECGIEVSPNELLADVLREKLGLTGTKVGCEAGDCGACTVLVDGEPTLSCLTLAIECEGKEILTIEGVADPETGELYALQKTFTEHGGVQCGFCTPAMILTAKALLDKNHNPTNDEIREAINGVICRCSGYMQIVESISAAAEIMR